jgi:hypothetical protein
MLSRVHSGLIEAFWLLLSASLLRILHWLYGLVTLSCRPW